jgi:hypothetical protein
MFAASLGLVFAVLGASDPVDPAELVSQLGASRFDARESAEGSLLRLGRLALPSLSLARKSKDPEIQGRASSLMTRIEGSLLVQATTIPLDFKNVPIEQVIEAINQRSGLAIALNPEQRDAIQGRRLTLQSAEPQPFWKAIDSLCKAGELHFISGAQVPLGQRDGTFLLYDGLATSAEPVSDSGPFRVYLTSVHYQNEIQLSQRAQPFGGRSRFTEPAEPIRMNPDSARQFFFQLLVSSEPRLSIAQNGLAKVTVAVDDKGQSLLIPANAGTFQHMAGYNGMVPSPTVRLRVDLARPEAAGKKIRLIRGTIPITVGTRKPDPLEIPIAGAVGQVFRNEEVAITVQPNRIIRGQSVTAMVELGITQIGQSSRSLQFGEGEPLGYRPDTPQQQIEILDAEGNSLAWFPSGTFYNGEPPVPALIRYHSLIRATADVPFEFRNLPMP